MPLKPKRPLGFRCTVAIAREDLYTYLLSGSPFIPKSITLKGSCIIGSPSEHIGWHRCIRHHRCRGLLIVGVLGLRPGQLGLRSEQTTPCKERGPHHMAMGQQKVPPQKNDFLVKGKNRLKTCGPCWGGIFFDPPLWLVFFTISWKKAKTPWPLYFDHVFLVAK